MSKKITSNTLLFVFKIVESLQRIFKNFAKFTGKHQRQSLLFNTVAAWRSTTSIKKRVHPQCFPVKFEKF